MTEWSSKPCQRAWHHDTVPEERMQLEEKRGLITGLGTYLSDALKYMIQPNRL